MSEDNDVDFDELDAMMNDDLPELNDPTETPDDVTTSVVGHLGTAVTENLEVDKLAKSFKKSMFRKLPGDVGSRADDALYEASNLMDKVNDNVEKTSKIAGRSLKGLSDILPEFMANPVKQAGAWLAGDDDSFGSGNEISEDERIRNEVLNIFGDVVSKESKTTESTELIQQLSSKKTEELLANVAVTNKSMLDTKYDIDNKYYRKSLELELKQTTTLLKMHDLMSTSNTNTVNQLEAIVKNTGLPDFAKNRSSDFVKQMMLDSAKDIGIGAFRSSSILSQASKNMENLMSDKLNTFVTGTQLLDTAVDAKAMMNEQGIGGVSMLMDSLVSSGVNKATDYASENLIKKMLDNEEGNRSIADVNKLLSDPAEAIRYFKDKYTEEDGEDSKRVKALNFASEIFKNDLTANSYNVKDAVNLKEATFLDNKLKDTINIIPNILTKILAEVSTIRKGNNIIDDSDRVVYDYQSSTFTNKQDQKEKIITNLKEKGKRLTESVDDVTIIEGLTGNKKLDADSHRSLMNGIITYLMRGKTTSPYYLISNDFLKDIDDGRVRGLVKNHLEKITVSGQDEDINAITELQSKLKYIQTSSISNYKDVVDSVNDTSDNSILQDVGIVDSETVNTVNNKVVHGDEYVFTSKKLNTLMEDVKKIDLKSITETISNIVKDVSSKKDDSQTYNVINSSIDKLTTKVSDLADNSKKSFNDKFFKNSFSSVLPANTNMDLGTFSFSDKQELKDTTDIYKMLTTDINSLITDTSNSVLGIKDSILENVTKYTDNLPSSWKDITTMYDKHTNTIMDSIPRDLDSLKKTVNGVFSSVTMGFDSVVDSLPDSFKELGNAIKTDTTLMYNAGNKYLKDNISKETKDKAEGYIKSTKVLSDRTINQSKSLMNKITANVPDVSKMSFTSTLDGNNSEMFSKNSLKPIQLSTNDKISNSVKNLTSTLSEQLDEVTANLNTSMTDINKNIPKDWKGLSDSFTEGITALKSYIPQSVNETVTGTFKDITETINETTGYELFKPKNKFIGPMSPEEFEASKTKETDIDFKPEFGEGIKNIGNGSIKNGLASIKHMFSELTDDSPEFMNNIKEIGKSIDEEGLDKILNNGLSGLPYPTDYIDAVVRYKKLFNGIDPSGKLWNTLQEEPDFIEGIQKIHTKVIEDSQKGLLAKGGAILDNTLDKTGGMIGNIRDNFINSLPKPVQGVAKKLLDNRFTKFAGSTVGNVKTAFKAAGKTTLNGLKETGIAGAEMFVGDDGRLKMPNIKDLVVGGGKAHIGITKALAGGVKELYPALFKQGINTGKLVGSSLLDFSGISGGAKKASAKMKAMVNPPVDRILYKQWTSGKLTGKEVLEQLETEDEKEKWLNWLQENDVKGITLPKILSATGKGYVKALFGSKKIIKPTYSTVGKLTKGLAKGIVKGAWDLSGIGDMFGTGKTKLPEVKYYTELLSKDNIALFNNDLETLIEDLEVDESVSIILNGEIDTTSKMKRNVIRTAMGKIDGLYTIYRTEDVKDKLIEARESLVELMLYVQAKYAGTTKKKKKSGKSSIKGKKKKKSSKGINPLDVLSIDKDETEDSPDKNSMKDVQESSIKEAIDELTATMKDTNIKISTPVPEKPEKPEFSIFDVDKDGDRDGNSIERREKLYGKHEDKKKPKTVIGKVKDFANENKTLLGGIAAMVAIFNPELLLKTFKGIMETFKAVTNSYTYIKNLGTSIGYNIQDVLSHVPFLGIDPVSDEQWASISQSKPESKPKLNPDGTPVEETDTGGNLMGNVIGAGVMYKAASFIPGSGLVKKGISSAAKGTYKRAKNAVFKKPPSPDIPKSPVPDTPKPKAKKGLVGKILSKMKIFKKRIFKRLGLKAATKISLKMGARFIPGLGLALITIDAASIGYKMYFKGMSLEEAISDNYLGFNIFDDNSTPVDENGLPIPTKEDEEKAKLATGKFDSMKARMRADNMESLKIDREIANGTHYPVNNYLDKDTVLKDTKKDIKKAYSNNIDFKTKKALDNVIVGETPVKEVVSKIDNTSVPNVNVNTKDKFSPLNGLHNIIQHKGARVDGLNDVLKDNLYSMANEYKDITGKSLPLNSGFRSYHDQMRLVKKYGKRAAKPGNSTHEFGLAFDTNTSTANELDKLGLMKKYGFTRPVGKETWHVEPAGIQLDINGAKHDKALADMLIDRGDGKGGSGWGTIAKSRKSSRNKGFQKKLLDVKGQEVTDKVSVMDLVKANKTKLALAKKEYSLVTDKSSTKPNVTNKNSVAKKKSLDIPKDNKPIVNIDTSKLNNKKELTDIHTTGNATTKLLDKSLRIQLGTHDKLTELVAISTDMLTALKGNIVPQQSSINSSYKNTDKTRMLDGTTPAVSHSVKHY